MATRDVVVRIRAEVGAFKKDMDAAAAKAKEAAKKTEEAGKAAESGIGRLAQTAQQHEKAWNQTANGMVAGGTAIVGALGLSTKAAMDWESTFTGVKKTVDGTPAQLARVETGLRGLAKTLPSTHAEIAGVAEAAGQLGVARDDVVGFTKTMIDLGESTNLTAEDAATNIAQISNVMGTMKREGTAGIERFGSALVALGNDGASTEAEILSMAQRIAGAGATIGATEADVLALSNTLASMGVRAELGGGVTTRVLLKMRSAVDEGGDSLQAFADVAGMSADEFAAKFRSAPVEALDLVSKGIYRVNEAGGNVTSTLKDMGIKGTEETQVMLALANSGDLLADSLKLGADAWRENNALAKEAGERYKTAESKVRIAWNNIKDAAIDAGSAILPAVATLAEGVADLVNAWQQLPGPVKSAVTLLGGAVGVAALAGGAFMKLAPAVVGTVGGLRDLAGALRKSDDGLGRHVKGANGTVGAMSKMEKAALGVAAAYTAIATAAAIASDARSGFDKDVESSEIVNALTDIAGKGDEAYAALDKVFNGSVVTGGGSGLGGAPTAVNDLASAMDRLFNTSGFDNFNDFLGTWLPAVESGSEVVRKNMAEMDAALVELSSSGKFDDAAGGFKRVMDAATARGAEVQDVIDMFPQYRDAAYQALTANGETQVSQERLVQAMLNGLPAGEAAAEGAQVAAGGMEALALTANETAASLDDILASLFELGRDTRTTIEAEDALTSSLSALNEAVGKNGKKFEGNSKAALENRSALTGVASDMESLVEAQARAGASGDEISSTMMSTYDAMMKATGGSEELVRKLLSIPPKVDVKTFMDEQAQQVADGTADAIEAIPGFKKVGIAVSEDGTVGQVQSKINEITGKTEYVFVTENGTTAQVQAGIASIKGKDVPVWVGDDGTVYSTQGKIDGIKGKDVTIFADAETRNAIMQLDAAAKDRYATIHTRVVTTKESHTSTGRGGRGGLTVGGYTGGLVGQLINGLAGGGLVPGKVPLNSLGDNVLATVGGKPFGLRSGEMVVNEEATKKNYPLLKAINDGAVVKLPGLVSGGLVGSAEKKVADLQKQLRRIPGDKKNRSRKADLQDDLQDARAELKLAKQSASARTKAQKEAAKAAEKRAKEAKKKAEEARKAAQEKAERMGELRFDLRRDLRRGEITDAFTSGSGMSVVDRLFEQSKNKDLSKGTRSRLRSTAYGMEGQLLRLEKRSDKLAQSLEKATKQRDDLLSARNAVRDQMTGAFDLGSLTGQKDEWGYGQGAGKKGLLAYGRSMAAGAKKLSGKVSKLQKLGFNESMIQQVIDEWTGAGTFELADAMLSMNKSERTAFVGSFKTVERYGLNTGTSLTKTMCRGGVDAAERLVDGLESKTKGVENAFCKRGKGAERSFKRALGIKSPSRVMKAAGINVGEGAELGILSKVGDVSKAAEQLMAPPALMVPPSPEVARYASAQAAAPSVAIDYDRLAEAMTRVQLRPVVAVGKNAAADIVEVGSKQAARRQ